MAATAPNITSSHTDEQNWKEGRKGEKKEGAFLIEENLPQKDHSRVPLLSHCLGMGHVVTPGCNGGCPGMYLTKGRGAATTVYTIVIPPLAAHMATKPNQGCVCNV